MKTVVSIALVAVLCSVAFASPWDYSEDAQKFAGLVDPGLLNPNLLEKYELFLRKLMDKIQNILDRLEAMKPKPESESELESEMRFFEDVDEVEAISLNEDQNDMEYVEVVEDQSPAKRDARVLCDLLDFQIGGLAFNDSLCAAHCLIRGHKGGYCSKKRKCVCRKNKD